MNRSRYKDSRRYLDRLQRTSIDHIDLINGELHHIRGLVREINSCSNDP